MAQIWRKGCLKCMREKCQRGNGNLVAKREKREWAETIKNMLFIVETATIQRTWKSRRWTRMGNCPVLKW